MSLAERLLTESRAASVRCDEERLHVSPDDGRHVSVPLRWYPRLACATPEERSRWEVIGAGCGIHWPDIDEDISVEGLLLGPAAPGVAK